ncbi:MAG: DUF922 domain-containing protein [Chitinophagaceae bacterium]
MPVTGFTTEITWSKFKKLKTRPANSDADGYTVARSQTRYSFARGEGGAIVIKTMNIAISMDTTQSWVVESKMTDELLQHEQGHFDITALGVREINLGALRLKEKTTRELEESIKDLNDTLQGKIDATNIRYDEQTKHSQAKTQQEKWDKAIAAEKRKAEGSVDNLPK